MKVNFLCLLLMRQFVDFYFLPASILGGNFPFVDTAKEILRNNTDIQACMNEAADLVSFVARLKEDHVKELEERGLKHAGEMSKLTGQISNLSASLETVMKTSKKQHENMAQVVRTAEKKLANHADEMTAIHDSVLGKLSILV